MTVAQVMAEIELTNDIIYKLQEQINERKTDIVIWESEARLIISRLNTVNHYMRCQHVVPLNIEKLRKDDEST